MTTLVKAWTGARDRLTAAQVDSPVIDARLLVEAACGVTRLDIVTDPQRLVSDEQLAILDGYVERRARRFLAVVEAGVVAQLLDRPGALGILAGAAHDAGAAQLGEL